jgi:hypothetical protein
MRTSDSTFFIACASRLNISGILYPNTGIFARFFLQDARHASKNPPGDFFSRQILITL